MRLQANLNKIKINYDNDVRKIDKNLNNIFEYVNIYGSFEANKNLTNQIYEVGLNLFSRNYCL
jgi:hypothetical protein